MPIAFHAAAALWVVGMLAFAAFSPDPYEAALQEDRFVEWWTVGLFAAAAIVRFRPALSGRQWFDLLVALFCLFVAGEEFSWGQRLFGFTPPAPFLEHNTQQELTLHNFADVFGQPKGVLVLALAGYGLLLPAVAIIPAGRRLLERIGSSPPPRASIPWFAVAAALLIWYPADFTGEWVEALAGGLFFVSALPPAMTFATGTAASAMAAVGLAVFSGWSGRGDQARLACAELELRAISHDIVAGDAAGRRLHQFRGSVHKRVWTSIEDGYLDSDALLAFSAAECSDADQAERRRYMIDPWGMAYWIRAERPSDGGRRVIVYSMGPNRRRDGLPGSGQGDDIAVSEVLVLADREE